MIEPPKKRYTKDFKLQIIREIEDGKTIAQAARDHSIHPSTIARWRKQYRSYGKLVFSSASHIYSLKDILLVTIAIIVVLGVVFFIERFIVMSHDLIGSEKGILSLEIIVTSVLIAAFVGNEVKHFVLDILNHILNRSIPKSEHHSSPTLEEVVSLLLAVGVSIAIYKAYNS